MVPFATIIAAKVVTSYTISGSRGDAALTVVLVVAAVALAVIVVFSVPVSLGSLIRTRALKRMFPSSPVLTIFNVVGLTDALHGISPEGNIPIRGYYGLVVGASDISLWRGGSAPIMVARIPVNDIQRARLGDPTATRARVIRVILDASKRQSAVEVPLKLVHATPIGAVSFDRIEAQQFVDLINARVGL